MPDGIADGLLGNSVEVKLVLLVGALEPGCAKGTGNPEGPPRAMQQVFQRTPQPRLLQFHGRQPCRHTSRIRGGFPQQFPDFPRPRGFGPLLTSQLPL